ncbi:MAG: hypothetical protein AAFZ80_03515 [Cyanobacteria bacterium P01_A01_bin.105]
MAGLNLLQADRSYTFRSYFEMPYEPDEILAEFGYRLVRQTLPLPTAALPLQTLPDLRRRLESVLPLVSLTSETARRETLVAPILMDVAAACQCQLRIEYPLSVNNWLKGQLNYLLRGQSTVLVIEAKNDDLTRGFTQLAVEMIALAQSTEQSQLYGAVTIGNAWNFGRLDHPSRQILQDIALYTVPNDLGALTSGLLGILS